MRESEFWRNMRAWFGAGHAPVVADQTALDALDSRTAKEALAAGVAPQRVWAAVCAQHELPEQARLGVDLGDPR